MPRVGLTPDRIVAEAATVADEVGLDRLTLAAVAQRCGVSLPGLYKHVNGLEAVKRDVALLAIRELTDVVTRAAVGLTGRECLRAVSKAYRSYALAHPGRYAASVQAPTPGDQEYTAVSDHAVAVAAAALGGYGLEGPDLIHAIRMWRTVCHGLVSLETAGGFGLPESLDLTFDHLIDALDATFRGLPSHSRPAVSN
ncbi:TetR/AcrR family transcriptional regulator [Actinoallomurus purpureus]|uniref:TetR/AcrR family transcriptional regulator n=1 Tax=Actinoallomurus purpureus TaxID=478114 RepID=UPI0020933C00|nr:TetR/AcrR family transcriptional regulator [Actinoallomurus purpureus]MCO6007100.1 TetR/AcrR family transcriptional regulator [Actinoallomurus purpureus]